MTAAAVTPVDTSPAGTLRRAAEHLRSGATVPPAGAMTTTTQKAALIALVARLRLPLAAWLDWVADEADCYAAAHPSNLPEEVTDGPPMETALAVLGEQR